MASSKKGPSKSSGQKKAVDPDTEETKFKAKLEECNEIYASLNKETGYVGGTAVKLYERMFEIEKVLKKWEPYAEELRQKARGFSSFSDSALDNASMSVIKQVIDSTEASKLMGTLKEVYRDSWDETKELKETVKSIRTKKNNAKSSGDLTEVRQLLDKAVKDHEDRKSKRFQKLTESIAMKKGNEN